MSAKAPDTLDEKIYIKSLWFSMNVTFWALSNLRALFIELMAVQGSLLSYFFLFFLLLHLLWQNLFFSFTRWGLCSCSSSTFFQQLVYCHIKFTLIIKLICAKKGVYIPFTLSFVCCCCFSLFTRTALTVKGFTERHTATQLHRVGGWRF